MSNSNDPEQIRAEIERTRTNLSRDVNALGEAVSPSAVADRQKEKAKEAVVEKATSIKEAVMGKAEDAKSAVMGKADDAKSAVMGAKDSVADSAHDARRAVVDATPSAGDLQDRAQDATLTARRKTQGNPLAAGLIALGAGWLLGSLLPATDREREAAQQVKEKAQPALSGAQSIAQDAVENLKAPVQDAVSSLKDSATDAVQQVKDQGTTAAADVRSTATDAAGTVKDHQQTEGTSLV